MMIKYSWEANPPRPQLQRNPPRPQLWRNPPQSQLWRGPPRSQLLQGWWGYRSRRYEPTSPPTICCPNETTPATFWGASFTTLSSSPDWGLDIRALDPFRDRRTPPPSCPPCFSTLVGHTQSIEIFDLHSYSLKGPYSVRLVIRLWPTCLKQTQRISEYLLLNRNKCRKDNHLGQKSSVVIDAADKF